MKGDGVKSNSTSKLYATLEDPIRKYNFNQQVGVQLPNWDGSVTSYRRIFRPPLNK